MRKTIVVTILSGLIFLSACSDPAADKSRAVTGEASQTASPAAAAQGTRYLITSQNSKIEFVINLKTAKALGLTIAPVVLFQADRLIR